MLFSLDLLTASHSHSKVRLKLKLKSDRCDRCARAEYVWCNHASHFKPIIVIKGTIIKNWFQLKRFHPAESSQRGIERKLLHPTRMWNLIFPLVKREQTRTAHMEAHAITLQWSTRYFEQSKSVNIFSHHFVGGLCSSMIIIICLVILPCFLGIWPILINNKAYCIGRHRLG